MEMGFRLPAGSLWRHQKSGKVYEIVCVSAGEEDGQQIVSYRPAPLLSAGLVVHTGGAQYDADRGVRLYPHVVHHRSVTSWFELVELGEGATQRFVRVQKSSSYETME